MLRAKDWGLLAGLLAIVFGMTGCKAFLPGCPEVIGSTLTLDPTSKPAGSAAFTLMVTVDKCEKGAQVLSPNAVVLWNGSPLKTFTTLISPIAADCKLGAEVPANLIQSAGTATVTVDPGCTIGSNDLTTSATFTIGPPVTAPLKITTTSLPDGTVGQAYSQAVSATGGKPPYSFSLAPTNPGSLPTGLSLDTGGTISGTPTTASTFNFTVQATDTSSPQQTAQQPLSITIHAPAGNNAKLLGNYAFLFNGLDALGHPTAMAGSFVADGNGNLTSGAADIIVSGGKINFFAFNGTYDVSPDNRGSFTLTAPVSNLGTFHFVLDSQGSARFIEFDTSGTRGSGIIKRQCPACGFTADFAFGFSGDLSGTRIGVLGRFKANADGTISNGFRDVSGQGHGSGKTAFGGSYALDTNVGQTGRGTATLNLGIPGAANSTLSFAFYIVSGGEAFFVGGAGQLFDTLLLSGPVLVQVGEPFTTGSLLGPSVFHLTGNDNGNSSVAVGQFTADGKGVLTGGALDQNDAGLITSAAVNFGDGTYSMDPDGLGRGFLQMAISVNGTVVADLFFTFYMVNVSKAFLVDAGGVQVQMGLLEPQTLPTSGGFAPTDFAGNYAFGTVTPPVSAVSDIAGVITLTSAPTKLSGTQDETTPSNMLANVPVGDDYSVSSSTNGRVTVKFTSPATSRAVFYLISPTKFVLISIDAGNTAAVVTMFEQ